MFWRRSNESISHRNFLFGDLDFTILICQSERSWIPPNARQWTNRTCRSSGMVAGAMREKSMRKMVINLNPWIFPRDIIRTLRFVYVVCCSWDRQNLPTHLRNNINRASVFYAMPHTYTYMHTYFDTSIQYRHERHITFISIFHRIATLRINIRIRCGAQISATCFSRFVASYHQDTPVAMLPP